MSGSSPLANGLVITGGAPKLVLLRAVGPTLGTFGIPGVLGAPILQVYNATGSVIASNAGWTSAANASDIAWSATRCGAFALNANSADSAVLMMLNPGSYTLQVTGQNGSAGTAMVEAYEVP